MHIYGNVFENSHDLLFQLLRMIAPHFYMP